MGTLVEMVRIENTREYSNRRGHSVYPNPSHDMESRSISRIRGHFSYPSDLRFSTLWS